MSQADRIRAHVLASEIEPARRRGAESVTVRAGDIHRDMGLLNAMPAVCSALGGRRLLDLAGVKLLERAGPPAGSNVFFTYSLKDREAILKSSNPPPAKPPARAMPASPTKPREFDLRGALVLVSCVKSKLPHPAPARELYTSSFFTMARDLVERSTVEWRILSALHGLVAPDMVIRPYDLTLNTLGISERRKWAGRVLIDLIPLTRRHDRVVFLAGDKYREFLIEPLEELGLAVNVPLRGLRQGEQLAVLRGQL